ncbi:MAG: CoA transferase [Dehalococcoidia bacterium]|nr:CoA transferase [Dehalococcoidia bacterium]
MGPLDGVTVVDFTSHLAGPYATKLMADLGARVVKVERPGGDRTRWAKPFLDDRPGIERSGTFQYLNTNKESLVLDLRREGAGDVLLALLQGADLVVSSFTPRQAEHLGMTYEAIRAIADRSMLWITNFGLAGPYRDYSMSDTTLFAMGGEMFSTGLADREPLKYGGTAALLQCGAIASVAGLGAIHAWELHDTAQLVEAPLFNGQLNNVDRRSAAILAFRFSGRIQERPPGPGSGLAGGVYEVADGYVEVTAAGGNYWQRFVAMIDDDALRDPIFASPAAVAIPEAKERCDAVVYPWMLTHTRADIWKKARKVHAMVAPLYDAVDLFNDQNLRDRGFWTEIEHGESGTLPMIGRPYILSETPWEIRRPAPRLGEHTDAILSELGFENQAIASLRADGVVA